VDALVATGPHGPGGKNLGATRVARMLVDRFWRKAPRQSAVPRVTIEAIAGRLFDCAWHYARHGRIAATALAASDRYDRIAPFAGGCRRPRESRSPVEMSAGAGLSSRGGIRDAQIAIGRRHEVRQRTRKPCGEENNRRCAPPCLGSHDLARIGANGLPRSD